MNDWESTILNIAELPDEIFIETIFRKQLDRSDQLKNAMSLYWLDITQKGESKSYEKLKSIVRLHLDKRKLERNKHALDRNHSKQHLTPAGSSGGGSLGPRKGDCRQWAKEGTFSRGRKKKQERGETKAPILEAETQVPAKEEEKAREK